MSTPIFDQLASEHLGLFRSPSPVAEHTDAIPIPNLAAVARSPMPAGPAPIYLTNQSTLLADADGQAIADACGIQLRDHFCPAWNIVAPAVHYVPRGVPVPTGGWNLAFLDTLDDPRALGWHSEDGSVIHGCIGLKAELDQGAQVLTGPYSVSSIASHEVLEVVADGWANCWRDTGKGWEMVQEVADPVQSHYYTLRGVDVSSFVLPAFFDAQAARGPFDWLGKLRGPFSCAAGGYFVYRRTADNTTGQHMGAEVPQWMRDLKAHPVSRTARIQARATA